MGICLCFIARQVHWVVFPRFCDDYLDQAAGSKQTNKLAKKQRTAIAAEEAVGIVLICQYIHHRLRPWSVSAEAKIDAMTMH
jgi:hypothetical protein